MFCRMAYDSFNYRFQTKEKEEAEKTLMAALTNCYEFRNARCPISGHEMNNQLIANECDANGILIARFFDLKQTLIHAQAHLQFQSV